MLFACAVLYCYCPSYFTTLFHKVQDFRKKYIFEIKYEFLVHLQFLSESLLSAVIIALNWSSGKVAVVQ